MVKIAHCSEELCDWEEFKEKYSCAIGCPFQKMCSRNSTDVEPSTCKIDYALNGVTLSGGNIDLISVITALVVSELF